MDSVERGSVRPAREHFDLECCVDSLESALAAEEGGATRLELCAELPVGGLSPSPFLFEQIRRACPLPIHAMVRPRGGDFLYSDSEFSLMRREVEQWRSLGADGVVFGMLTADGRLDAVRMRELLRAARGMCVTLHRAFDCTPDAREALGTAASLGFSLVLTSGQKPKVGDGCGLLADLEALRLGPTLMAGAGLDTEAAERLWDVGLRAFHLSGGEPAESAMRFRRREIRMAPEGMDEFRRNRCSAVRVAAVRRTLDRLATESGGTAGGCTEGRSMP